MIFKVSVLAAGSVNHMPYLWCPEIKTIKFKEIHLESANFLHAIDISSIFTLRVVKDKSRDLGC